jgi:hypothetical protein
VIGGYRPDGSKEVDALLVGYYDGRDLRFGWESLLKSPGSSPAQATRPTAVMLPEAEATHPITL